MCFPKLHFLFWGQENNANKPTLWGKKCPHKEKKIDQTMFQSIMSGRRKKRSETSEAVTKYLSYLLTARAINKELRLHTCLLRILDLCAPTSSSRDYLLCLICLLKFTNAKCTRGRSTSQRFHELIIPQHACEKLSAQHKAPVAGGTCSN